MNALIAHAFQVSVNHLIQVKMLKATRNANKLSIGMSTSQWVATKRVNSQDAVYRLPGEPSHIVAYSRVPSTGKPYTAQITLQRPRYPVYLCALLISCR